MAFGKQSFNQFQIEGVVTSFNEQTSKNGKKFAKAILVDVNDAEFGFTAFGEGSLDAVYNASKTRGNVIITGRIDSRPYQTKSGEKRASFELVVFNAFPVESAGRPAGRASAQPDDNY